MKLDSSAAIGAQLTVGESGRVYVTVVGRDPSTMYFLPGQKFDVCGRLFMFEPLAVPGSSHKTIHQAEALSEIPMSPTGETSHDLIAAALVRSNRSLETCHAALRVALDSQRRMRAEYEQRLAGYRRSRTREVNMIRARVREARAAKPAADPMAERKVAQLAKENAELLEQLASAERKGVALYKENASLRDQLVASAKALEVEKLRSQRELDTLKRARTAQDTLRPRLQRAAVSVRALRSASAVLSSTVTQAVRDTRADLAHMAETLVGGLRGHDARLREMRGKLQAAEDTRRRLHEQVMELKGNIRVYCRVRPLLCMTICAFPSNGACVCVATEPPLDQKHFFFSGDGQTIEVVTPPERTALDTGGDVREWSACL